MNIQGVWTLILDNEENECCNRVTDRISFAFFWKVSVAATGWRIIPSGGRITEAKRPMRVYSKGNWGGEKVLSSIV